MKPTNPAPVNRAAVIGPDAVAALDAYSLLTGGAVDELILIGEQALSLLNSIEDLCRFVPLPHKSRVRLGSFEDAILAPLAIVASGRGCNTSVSELSEEEALWSLADEFACVGRKLRENSFDGAALIVSDPVDVLAEVFLENWRGPASKVIGLGPGSARMDRDDGTDGPLKGETRWCTGGFAHIKSMDACSPHCPYFGAMIEETHKTAAETFGQMYHSPMEFAACVTQVYNAIVNDTRTVIPVFTKPGPEFGFDGAFLNLPSVIGRNGVEAVLTLGPEKIERERLNREAVAFARSMQRIHDRPPLLQSK